jgi:hypothetical protein
MHRLSTKVGMAMTTSIESRSPTPERRVRFARSASPESPRHEAPTASYRGRQLGFQRDAYNEEQRGETQHTGPCTRRARNHGKNAFCPARDPRKVCYYCRKPGHFQAACLSARDNTDGVASQLPTMGSLLRQLCSENLIAVWSPRIASPRQSLKILKTGIIC